MINRVMSNPSNNIGFTGMNTKHLKGAAKRLIEEAAKDPLLAKQLEEVGKRVDFHVQTAGKTATCFFDKINHPPNIHGFRVTNKTEAKAFLAECITKGISLLNRTLDIVNRASTKVE